MRWRSSLVGLSLALALVAGAAQSQPFDLSPDQMRGLAGESLQRGSPSTALTLTQALLKRDPDDLRALLLQARAARDAGDYTLARQSASRAWELSQTDEQRYASAVIMAQALSSDGARTRAQIWLRRAVQYAPDERARRRAITDYRYVRSRNPLSTRFSFNIAPNSNINNGSISDTTQFFDPFTRQYIDVQLRGASRALSGVELSLGATLRYRFAESATAASDAVAYFDSRSYRLSDEARRIAPTARGSDFATSRLLVGLEHRWIAAGGRVEHQVSGTLGKSRYGGDPYSDTARLAYDAAFALPGKDRLRLGAAMSRTRGPRAPHADGTQLSASLTQNLDSGGRLTWSLSGSDSRSDVSSADFREVSGSVDYALARPIMGALPSLGLSLRHRDYPVSPYGPDGRRDREVAARLQLTFVEVDYYGFNPTLTVEAARSRSNIGLFDVDRFGLQLGIQSAF